MSVQKPKVFPASGLILSPVVFIHSLMFVNDNLAAEITSRTNEETDVDC